MELDTSALQPGVLLAGKFRVVRCLGLGGMGAVYEIEHELTKHRRALKLLHPQMTQIAGVVERFLREASAAGRVGNPHIIETFDAGTLETGEPYLVMELLRGEPLTSRIERGPMSVADVVDLVGQACEGVQAAHDAGIVHRDLKPDNLFVVDAEGRLFVKILDFGISKFDPSKTGGMALTQEGASLGTPYYMSPEQIRGESSLDVRADVYALGVILYECLAGCRPFEAEVLTQLAVLIHMGKPRPLEELRPDIPPSLAAVVTRAMATDQSQRTQTAMQLRSELERFGVISGPLSRYGAPSAVAPRTVPAHSAPPPATARAMATSAAGVSTRDARAGLAGKSPVGPVVAGFGVLGALAVAGFVFLRSGPPTPGPAAEGEPSAASHAMPVAASPAAPAAAVPASPGAPEAPAASASAAPASASRLPRSPTSATNFPVVAPTLDAPAPPPAPPPVVAGPAKPEAAPAPKPKLTNQKGLATDNPFK